MRTRTLLPSLFLGLVFGLGAITSVSEAAPRAPTAAPDAAKVTVPASPTAKPVIKVDLNDPAVASLERFSQSIERLTLANGLRVVLAPDNSAKTVAVSITYGVGSRDEGPGQSGFAHLFEHMMFQGSQHVPKGLHFTLISQRGGSLNGTTSADRTNYFEVLPSSELRLSLWLEADRMRALAVTPENLENQRAVVKEEYRMRIDNAAYQTGLIRLGSLIFADYAPYVRPTIGTMAELDAAKFEWVKAFYDHHYAPNSAVLTISGDFDRDEAVGIAREYFEGITRKAEPRAPLPALPTTVKSARDVVRDSNAKTPGFFYGYLIPPARTDEHYALEVAVSILADGESSRLYRLLVRERELSQSVSAWTRDQVGADELGISVVLTEKAKLAPVQALVDNELAKLGRELAPAAELDKVKRRIRTGFVSEIQTNMSRATHLGEYESYFGDARLLGRELGRYQAVSAEDVRAAVKKYLGTERRQVVEVLPVEAPAAAKAVKP